MLVNIPSVPWMRHSWVPETWILGPPLTHSKPTLRDLLGWSSQDGRKWLGSPPYGWWFRNPADSPVDVEDIPVFIGFERHIPCGCFRFLLLTVAPENKPGSRLVFSTIQFSSALAVSFRGACGRCVFFFLLRQSHYLLERRFRAHIWCIWGWKFFFSI